MAAPVHTMPGTAPAVPNALPSIEALGRRLAAVTAAYYAADEKGSAGHPRARSDVAILSDQADALSDLISTMRAGTLADAAVQAHVAADFVSIMTGCDLTRMERQQQDDYLAKIERLLVSIVPVVAASAGIDTGSMIFADDANLAGTRFDVIEAVA